MRKLVLNLVVMGPIIYGCGSEPSQGLLAESSDVSMDHPAFTAKRLDPKHYDPLKWLYETESLCGDDDMIEVADYKEHMGIDRKWLKQRASAVGAMERTPDGEKFCTGTLISDSLFLTAGHCVSGSVESDFVTFNYQMNAKGEREKEVSYRVAGLVESSELLDYAVLKITGAPGKKLGHTRLNFLNPKDSEDVAIIQHPGGGTKKFARGELTGIFGNYVRYSVDTKGGSSGSGVVDFDGNLVAVHTNGGCHSLGGTNSGVRLGVIPEDSMLRTLVKDKTAVVKTRP